MSGIIRSGLFVCLSDLSRVWVEYAYSEWVSTGSMEVNVLCKGRCNRSQLVSIFDGNGYVCTTTPIYTAWKSSLSNSTKCY